MKAEITAAPSARLVASASIRDAIPADRLWSIVDIATYLNVSRRGIERLKSACRLPKPTLFVGCLPRWSPELIRGWVAEGGRP